MIESTVAPKMPSIRVRKKCRSILMSAARRHKVPAAYIVAHVRYPAAVKARKEVMLAMLEMGLTRAVIAHAFGRDLRRVRASVIGSPKPQRVWLDYTRVDLFGEPLPDRSPRRSSRPSAFIEACRLLKQLAPLHPECSDWLKRHFRVG